MKLVAPVFRFYRAAIAPAIGNVCRFEPSCSHYAEEALGRWGLVRGLGLTLWRLLRCHPFSRGGLDPVPPRGGKILARERA
jgi:putative membrane protein insertion efficiency factor